MPTDLGRCSVGVLTPDMSFVAGEGWSWTAHEGFWSIGRNQPRYAIGIIAYEYGGSVVPASCEEPAPTVAMARASDVVAWLETIEGLEVAVTARSIGPYPAWQLDLAAHDNEPCPGPLQVGGVRLWTVKGLEPGRLPTMVPDGWRYRFYLIELPDTIVVMHALVQPYSGEPSDVPDSPDVYEPVEAIFRSLQFEAPRPRITPAPTPVLEARGVTTEARLASAGLEFVPREGGETQCWSHAGRLDVAAVAAYELGELGGGTLKAWIDLDLSGARSHVEVLIDGADIARGRAQPFWDGFGTPTLLTADGATGSIRFDVEAEPVPVAWDPYWPASLSGSFSWSCGEWSPPAD